MKQIFIITFILFVSQIANAQVYVGLSSGVAITKFKTTSEGPTLNKPSCKSLVGFNLDVPVLFKLTKNVAIQSGLSYLNMGTTINRDYSSYYVIDVTDPIYQALLNIDDTKYRLNYLSVPLTCNFSIPLNKYSVYIKAGGYISTLLYGTNKSVESDSKKKLDLGREQLNTLDIGGILGGGMSRTIGSGFLFFDVRYMIGISNLNESTDILALSFGSNEVNNRGVFFNVGYMFNLGNKASEK